ncbi:RNA-directed DNA polymerase [Tanacetum coccineum]
MRKTDHDRVDDRLHDHKTRIELNFLYKWYVDQLSRSLYVEYKDLGIEVQCQVPLYVYTNMTSQSMVKKTSLFTPTPDEYVKAAIRHIGFESRCTPYWPHSIQWFFASLAPDFLLDAWRLSIGIKRGGVPVTIKKFYKEEVLCIVDDIDECHILLRKPWRCEVNGKYDVKRNLYLFQWEGRRIAMLPSKVTPQLPKPEVKVEKKIVKAEVIDEHIEKIQDLQSYKQHDDKISTLLFQTTNKVDTLKTCEEIMGFNDDEDVKGFNCELKTDFE